jgi:type II secretion system protein N
MSETPAATGPGPLPRRLLLVGVPIAGVILVAFFFFLGFPWDSLRDLVASQASTVTGTRIAIAELGPGFTPLGPALEARGVTATLPGGEALRLNRARVRPAWSLRWLRGDAALAVDLSAPEGRLRGTVYAGSEPGFDGRIDELDLGRLPLSGVAPDLALDGLATADVDVRSGERGPEGRVELHAVEGSVGLPGLPVALPFQSLDAAATLGGDAQLRLERFALGGPMLSAEGEAVVASAPAFATAPLDATLHIEVHEAGVRPMVRNLGVRLDAGGRADVRLGGTLAAPTIR